MNGKSSTVEKDIKLDLLFLNGIVKYKDSQLVCRWIHVEILFCNNSIVILKICTWTVYSSLRNTYFTDCTLVGVGPFTSSGEWLLQIRCRAATIWLNFISYVHIIFCRDMTICHDVRFISKIFVSLHENDSLHCNLVCYY